MSIPCCVTPGNKKHAQQQSEGRAFRPWVRNWFRKPLGGRHHAVDASIRRQRGSRRDTCAVIDAFQQFAQSSILATWWGRVCGGTRALQSMGLCFS